MNARVCLECSAWTFGILRPRQTICHTHTHALKYIQRQSHTLTASLSLAAVQLQSVFSSLVCQIQRRGKRKRGRQTNRWRRKVGEMWGGKQGDWRKRKWERFCVLLPSNQHCSIWGDVAILLQRPDYIVSGTSDCPTYTHNICVDRLSLTLLLLQICVKTSRRVCVCVGVHRWSDQYCTQTRHTGITCL